MLVCKGNILKKKETRIVVSIGNQEKIGGHTKLVAYRKEDLGIKFIPQAKNRGNNQ